MYITILDYNDGTVARIEISKGDPKSKNHKEKRAREDRLKKEALSHPLVNEAVEIFNGKVVEIKIL